MSSTVVKPRAPSGKEATVYVCRAHPETGREYFALKVYKELTKRSFRNDSRYQEARLYRNNRVTRAFEQKSEFGQSVQFGLWVGMEFENLRNLFEAGVYVPEPIKQVGPTILMEFYGINGAAATLLQNARLSQQQAREVWTLLKANIEVDRKILAELAVHEPASFAAICEQAKAQLNAA